MYTPPLHKLPHGAARGPPAPGLNPREHLPQDAIDQVLEQLIASLGADELCTTLYERCLLLTPPGAPGARPRCGPERPLWKKACERMGLTRASEGDWHATFQRLCRQLRRLATPFTNAAWEAFSGHSRQDAIEAFLARVRGEYIPMGTEDAALGYIMAQGHLPLVAEAFVGLGAVPLGYIPDYFGAAQAAIASGDVALIRGVIGTGPNAGVRELTYAADGEVQKVRLLLDMGVNVNALWNWHASLLMVCVYSLPDDENAYDASTKCIELLLQAGANVNWSSTVGDRDSTLTRLLRDEDRIWEDTQESQQVLIDRCWLLLKYGANPNHVAADGATPLTLVTERFASRVLKNELVEALRGYGAVA